MRGSRRTNLLLRNLSNFWQENKNSLVTLVLLLVVFFYFFPPTVFFESQDQPEQPDWKEAENLGILQRKYSILEDKLQTLQQQKKLCEDQLIAGQKEKAYAYVFFIAETESKKLWPHLVGIYSLLQTNPNPNIDIVVGVTTETSRVIHEMLKQLSPRINIKEWLPIYPPEGDQCFPTRRIEFTKLNAWALTEYSRVCLLDTDVLVTRNVDEIFEIFPTQTKFQVASFLLNGGTYVLKPNLTTYEHLVNSLVNAEVPFDETNCEIGFIAEMFKNRFFPISHYYNLMAVPTEKFFPRAEVEYVVPKESFRPLSPDFVGIFHFTADVDGVKPWFRPPPLCQVDPEDSTSDLYYVKRWWDLRSRMVVDLKWLNNYISDNMVEPRWDPSYHRIQEDSEEP